MPGIHFHDRIIRKTVGFGSRLNLRLFNFYFILYFHWIVKKKKVCLHAKTQNFIITCTHVLLNMCIHCIHSMAHILYVPMCVQSFCFLSCLIASVLSYYLQFWNLHPQICYNDIFLTTDSKLCFLLTVIQMLSNQNCDIRILTINIVFTPYSRMVLVLNADLPRIMLYCK